MTINCMGRVNVATPGTPVPLSTDPRATASKLFFQVIPGLTGKMYVGVPSMTTVTLDGVARILMPNSAGDFSETYISRRDRFRERGPHRNEWRGSSGPELECQRTLVQKHSEAVQSG